MNVLYEDNHIIVINKAAGEIVQGDKTGDKSLCDTMKTFLKEKYAKPGNVFVGLPHRLDRPVSGVVVFAKTSKALERLNTMFRDGAVKKIYWAIPQRGKRKQACTALLSPHCRVTELQSHRGGIEDRSPSSDTLPARFDRMSNKRRS